MNYKRNEEECSVIADKITEFKFKQKARKIYEGADTNVILKYVQWEERCRKLLDTFFYRDGANSGIILFPDIDVALLSQIRKVEKWKTVMSILNDWCQSSSSEDEATGLIIRKYDVKDHFDFRKITEDEIKDTLGLKSSANIFNFQKSDARFLVFNPSLKNILIIRLVEIRKGDSKLLKKEIDYCIDEVNLVSFLLRDDLEDTGVVVTGFVAYSGENAHCHISYKDFDSIIFPFEIFNSVETFKNVCERKIEDFARIVARNVKEEKENVFQAVASKMLGYLSHLQFKMLEVKKLEEPVLPVTEKDAADNIKQAELLLNCYQMEIAYSDDKRIWLEGNYGTGKTVVALKKLELLLKDLKDKDKEVIYYVSFARKSLLDLKIKQRFEEHKNVRAIRGEYSLTGTIKHQILRKEKEIGTKNIHLIMDEYNSQDLSTEEVENLIPLLNNEEKLKNSTVLIAVQPIKITRIDKFCENGIKRQFSETKHELHKLITATGIKVKTLKNVMRTTVQINKLAEITRDYLDNKSNRCVRPQQYYDDQSRYEEATDLDLDQKYSKEANLASFQSASQGSNFSLSVTSDHSFNHTSSSPPLEPKKLIDYDEYYKLVDADISAGEENFQETVTSYSFTCQSKIGHGISGSEPQFIKFTESADLYEQVALIAAVLDKIMGPAKRKPKRIAVIHLEHNDPPWLKSLFQLKKISPRLKVTDKVEEFLKDTNKNLVLVKNLYFLRGLEFSKVLLILDSDEHHLRHVIPEAITRCTGNLSILIRPSVQWNPKSDTVADLVHEWEKHAGLLRILEIGFCSKTSCNSKTVQQEVYCKDEKPVGMYYGVHKKSKLFEDFLKEIKLKEIRNVQAEYKDSQKEAEAS